MLTRGVFDDVGNLPNKHALLLLYVLCRAMLVCSKQRWAGSVSSSATPDGASSCPQNAVALAAAAAEEALKAAETASVAKAKHDSASAEPGGVEAMEVDDSHGAGEQVVGIQASFRAYGMRRRSNTACQSCLDPAPAICKSQLGTDLQHGPL